MAVVVFVVLVFLLLFTVVGWRVDDLCILPLIYLVAAGRPLE